MNGFDRKKKIWLLEAENTDVKEGFWGFFEDESACIPRVNCLCHLLSHVMSFHGECHSGGKIA